MKWIEAIDRLPKKGAVYCFDKRYNQKKLLFYNPRGANSIINQRPKDILWIDENMTVSEIEIWNKACEETLKSISNVFLNPSNQDKADKNSDKEIFQAVGETIVKFPKPIYNPNHV